MKTKFPRPSLVPLTGRFGFCFKQLKGLNTRNKVFLDIGSSAGTLEAKIKDFGFKRIIGIEPNARAVEFAKENVKGVSFYVATAAKLPLESDSVDIIAIFDVIEHVPAGGEVAALQEAARVLKRGGKLLLTTPNDHLLTDLGDPAWYFGHRHYSERRIREIVKNAGLKVVRIGVYGDFWSSIYFIWLYVSKWILGKTLPRNRWIERKEDEGYRDRGIFTLFAEAQK